MTSPPKRVGSPSVLPPDKIVKITDGDTLYVLDANYKDHKIRLAGIDAPERRQAYGLASRKHLLSIVAGKQVTVEYQKRDRYGRIVGNKRRDVFRVRLI